MTCRSYKGCFKPLQKHLSAKKYKKDLNDTKEAELCAIAEDHFKDIKNKSMREVAKAQYVTDALDKNSASVCDLVKEKFGGSRDDLYSRYNKKMNQPCCGQCSVHPSRPSAEKDYCVSYQSQKQSLGSNICFQCW
jgi:hypothetical protein